MKLLLKSILIIALLGCAVPVQAFLIHDLKVKAAIDPGTGELAAQVSLTGTPAEMSDILSFTLNSGFTISRIRVDRGRVDWERISETSLQAGAEGPAYDARWSSTKKRKRITFTIEYAGKLTPTETDRITSAFVELTKASAWFPVTGDQLSSYQIEIIADSTYQWVSTGNLKRLKPSKKDQTAQTIFQGWDPPESDLVIVGARDFTVSGGAGRGLSVRVYHTREDSLPAETLENLVLISDYFRDRYGPPPARSVVIWVRSPRQGPDYVRPPLFVSGVSGADNGTVDHLADLLSSLWWEPDGRKSVTAYGIAQCAAWLAVETVGNGEAAAEMRRLAGQRLSGLIAPDPQTRSALMLAWALYMMNKDRDISAALESLIDVARRGRLEPDRLEAAFAEDKPLPQWWNPMVRDEHLPDLVLRAQAETALDGAVVKGRIVQVGQSEFSLPVDLFINGPEFHYEATVFVNGRETRFEIPVEFLPGEVVLDPGMKLPLKHPSATTVKF